MTLCHVLRTNKPFLSYQKILKDIKLLVENYIFSWDMNKVKFISDFEKSLIKAIKIEFKNSNLHGVFSIM